MRILAVAFVAVACCDYVIHAGIADKLYFLETFSASDSTADELSSSSEVLHGDHQWIKSKVGKYLNQPVLIKPPNKPAKGYESDSGLQLTQEMKHYGLSSRLSEPFDFSSMQQDFIVQYEVRLEESLECGGAYIKLLREGDQSSFSDQQTALSDASPYTIMFGPDKCGSTNKVHFIVQYQNPITKVWSEKHFNETLAAKIDKATHLYTLHLKKDSSFDIYIDMKLAKSGSLLTHLTPPINPTEFIDDPDDVKPSDWVDSTTIPDPDAVKPDDWDESQPMKVVDKSAVKPDAWDEDAPATIPDPSAVKPDDWDDEEDGEWEAPSVPNPVCDSAGCSPWTPPLIANPLYKGKWKRPQIPNPSYKGPWKAAQIRNPGYHFDPNPVLSLAPVQAIAIEVWTITAGIIFDNFLIATSIADALKYGRETTALKAESEKKALKAQEAAEKQKSWKELLESGSYKDLVVDYVQQLSQLVADNPVATAVSMALIVLTFLYLVLFGGGKQGAARTSDGAVEENEATSEDTKVQGGQTTDDVAATTSEDAPSYVTLDKKDIAQILVIASNGREASTAAKELLAPCGIAQLPWFLTAVQNMKASSETVTTNEFTLPRVVGEEFPATEGAYGSSTAKVVVCLLPTNKAARHNAPSKPHIISSTVKSHRSSGNCLIALVPELAEYAFSQACAVARCFPLYTLKTSNNGRDKVSNNSIIDIVLSAHDDSLTDTLLESIRVTTGQIRSCQALVDMPPNVLTTDHYVSIATAAARDLGCDAKVISGQQLKEQGFGGLFAVGQASVHPPALVVLSCYPEEGADLPSVCLVGKGIVYDTGGLSIKTPTASMAGMKMDMGGSAAVLGSFICAVKMHQTTSRKLLRPLHALLCIAENSVDERSMRPDDVITMLSGRTVEVNNTDAEGRLVLSDGCCYASRHLNPSTVIDIATLTGAQLIATGRNHAGIYCNSDALEALAVQVGRTSGDLVHPLPYCPEFYKPEFSSKVADMKNSVRDRSNAQSSCAAQFIANHIEEYLADGGQWLHVDMAGPAWADDRGTGYGVALLSQLVDALQTITA